MNDFDAALQAHLQKCELEFRAKNAPAGSYVSWLGDHCNSTAQIACYLRELGFHIKRVVDDVDCEGRQYRYVVTTSHIIVYANSNVCRGLIAQEARDRTLAYERKNQGDQRKVASAPKSEMDVSVSCS